MTHPTEHPPQPDDAYGGYRGMWRDAEDEVQHLRNRLLTQSAEAERLAEADWYAAALKAIRGPAAPGPFIEAYRAAGGGYEGLQAIARLALNE